MPVALVIRAGRVLLPFAAIVLLGGGAQAQTCEPEKASTKYPVYAAKAIKVAASAAYPPFSYSDPKDLNRLTGLEIELIEAVLKCAGLKFSYFVGPWSGTLPAILSGAADVAVGNINHRPDRAKQVDFVVFMRNGQSVMVQKGNPLKIKEASDLCGKSASASIGGSSMLELERQSQVCVANGKPAMQLLPAVEMEAAYRQLANDRINFVMDGTASASARLEKTPDFDVAYSLSTDIAFGPVLAKNNDEMTKILVDGVKILYDNGEIKKLTAKYKLPLDFLIPVEVRKE